ncbi:HisA/HisF-related TIM barrel protein [Hydrogenibacillus schlegelii]|uniref:Imidazole glycerol phosphate synthase subunit HisF n=2 Tax=Hydrogenibacillus schlegelii TaxID=1484 RepID=A0A179IMT5_HYDSH|nr:HisA/HisF-related TIM barrel protein [Hydrogenibacillus schlegelii]OAR03563.1 hypothetical protein SA87_02710 [Hydrogenibacillus schlegelii]
MSEARWIIPCLDVRDGRVVKGVAFRGMVDVGDPVALARRYDREGADAVALLDITATVEGRETFVDVVRAVRAALSVPLIVGGGIRDRADVRRIRAAGADFVAIGTAAVERPEVVEAAAEEVGAEAVVVALDAAWDAGRGTWVAVTHGGRRRTDRPATALAAEWARRGAGWVLLTSVDADGTKAGFDLPLIRAVAEASGLPVIASGGAGAIEHFVAVFRETPARAALAASVFHRGEIALPALKAALGDVGIAVRPAPAAGAPEGGTS